MTPGPGFCVVRLIESQLTKIGRKRQGTRDVAGAVSTTSEAKVPVVAAVAVTIT